MASATGPRPAARRQQDRLAQHLEGPRAIVEAAEPFCARGEEGRVVEFLEGIAVDMGALDVLDQDKHRNGGLEGFA
jgi:hypothetical protein